MVAKGGTGAGPQVAVLGTGIMGSAMARNLVKAGLHTTGLGPLGVGEGGGWRRWRRGGVFR